MKIGLTVACLSVFCALCADESVSVNRETKAHNEIDIPCIQRIVFCGDWDQVQRSPSDAMLGVQSKGVVLLERNREFLNLLEKNYVGLPMTRQIISSLKQEIIDFYEKQNQPFASVSIPKQNFSNGVLQVIVEEAKLGEIRVEGNRYFTGKDLSSYIQTKPGSAIVTKDVVQDVAWMNQNPFRKTDVLFVPGRQPGTADLELATVDRWPYRVYVGSDNTGTISTARDRLFFGFDFGKTVLKDSQVAYQFSFSPNWNRFYAHTVSARVPCPWRHVAIFYGGYSQVEPSLDVDGEKEKGTAWQVDGRYRIPFMRDCSAMQEFIFGYDFKETDNRVRDHGHTTFRETVDINQFMLGYELGYSTKHSKLTFVIEGFGNPGGITTKNHTSDYEKFRSGAKAQYAYLKMVHSFAKKTSGGWWLSYDFSAQLSSTNLLPSEQFTLTGYNAVRGFEERILNVDNAALINLSVECPHWSPAKTFGWTKKIEDDFYLLAFFDGGFGCSHTGNSDGKKWKSLGSIGPGMRYQFSRYVTGRLDYGFQLWHAGFKNFTNSRYNFGLIVSY